MLVAQFLAVLPITGKKLIPCDGFRFFIKRDHYVQYSTTEVGNFRRLARANR
jgi:hypothetical protein